MTLGGMLALLVSVLVLYTMAKMMFWSFLTITILLTWIGARPVEEPFIVIVQLLTCLYFSYFLINPLLTKMWEKWLF